MPFAWVTLLLVVGFPLADAPMHPLPVDDIAPASIDGPGPVALPARGGPGPDAAPIDLLFDAFLPDPCRGKDAASVGLDTTGLPDPRPTVGNTVRGQFRNDPRTCSAAPDLANALLERLRPDAGAVAPSGHIVFAGGRPDPRPSLVPVVVPVVPEEHEGIAHERPPPAPLAAAVASTVREQGPSDRTLLAAAAAGALLLVPVVLLYRRLLARRVLENETRARVLDTVHASPGVTAAEVSRRVGVHYRTVRHHLEVLCEFGQIEEVRLAGRVRFFENHGRFANADHALLAARDSPPQRAIVAALASSPALAAGDLARRVGLAPSTMSFHLARLREAGLVVTERSGREVRCSLSREGRASLTTAGYS